MTLDEVLDFISQDLAPWQRDANMAFLRRVHTALHEGGVWVYPERMLVFTKTADGFDLMLDSEAVLVEQ